MCNHYNSPGGGCDLQRLRPEIPRIRDQEAVSGSLCGEEDTDRHWQTGKTDRGWWQRNVMVSFCFLVDRTIP